MKWTVNRRKGEKVKALKITVSIILALMFVLAAFSCAPSKAPDGDRTGETTTDADPEKQTDPESALSLKTMSFNLRYDTTSHALMGTGVRGEHLMEIIDKYKPDSIGFCEATNDWMNYLRSQMKKRGYEYVGLGRDRGEDSPTLTGTGNEHTPVFYDASRFELVEGDTFWLSTTPDAAGTVSWNSACNRVVSYVVLKEKESGKEYAHFATHLDHVSFEAQYNSVRIIQSYIDDIYTKYGNIGVVLSGDFNCTEFESKDKSYVPYTYNFTTSYMDDSLKLAAKKGVTGSTWSGYQNPVDWENGHPSDKDKPAVDTSTAPIDYIFLSKGKFKVDYYTVVNDTFTFEKSGKTWHNHPVSDHYGLYVECVLNTDGAKAGFDESKCIEREAEVLKTASLPGMPSGCEELVAGAKLTSGLSGTTANLKVDGEYISPNKRGAEKHLYWEITAALSDLSEVSSVSFRTSSEKMPVWAECFVSNDKSNWNKVGALITEKLEADTVYTWSLAESVECGYVKIVFVNCAKNARLDRFVIYGKMLGSGKIALTPVSGPKSGADEGFEKIIDGDSSTKFYINTSKDELKPLVFKTDGMINPTGYTMTSANDTPTYPDRVPAGWILYGSSDGEEWSVIDEIDDPGMKADSFVTYEYPLGVNGIYSYFKLEFKLGSTGKTQIAEFAIFS